MIDSAIAKSVDFQTSLSDGSHRIRRVRADDADAMIEEFRVDAGDFDLRHVTGDAVALRLRADFAGVSRVEFFVDEFAACFAAALIK